MKPRAHSPELEIEYLVLKTFAFAFPELLSNPSKLDDLQVYDRLEECEIPLLKRDLIGMRMAVNDCIEQSSHWGVEAVIAADAALRQRGILTLSEVRRRFSKKLLGILKRGRIRGEVEWYLVAGVLADQINGVSDNERLVLEEMSDAYARNAA